MPAGGLTMMNLVVPLSVIGSNAAVQLVVLELVFCCKVNPVDGAGQASTTVFVVVRNIRRKGEPAI